MSAGAANGSFRVLVCGSREFHDGDTIWTALLPYAQEHGDRLEVIHGDARGADRTADAVAHALGVTNVRAFPADWRGHGKAAGPIRNRLMLDERPDVVLAFKDYFDWSLNRGGTENMVKIASDAGVPCFVFDRGQSERVVLCGYGARPESTIGPEFPSS